MKRAAILCCVAIAGCADGGSSSLDAGGGDALSVDASVDALDLADTATDGFVAVDAQAEDSGPEGPAGQCLVEVTYRSTAAAPSVFVGGSFNDFSPTATPLVDDGTGTYRAALWLEPGVYPYKLIVEGDGEEPWRLDPNNPYRAYFEGTENSGLQVPDCFVPRFEPIDSSVTGDAAQASFRYVRGREGRAPGDWLPTAEVRTGRAVSAATVTMEGDVATVEASGLATGKHVLTVRYADEPAALAPLWVETERFEWEDALVYVVMPDRFANGEPGNDPAPTDASAGADYEGGDLQGLRDTIEAGYFESIGVNTLWVTPWHEGPPNAHLAADDFHRVTGYHGYWPTDPFVVDVRFGGEEALHQMIEAAHRHGIRVLMDLVANHVHEDHPYVADHPEWFNQLDDGGCVCGTPECDWTARRLDCLFRPYMPDVDWTNLEAQEQILEDAMVWLEDYDLDGFRVDAVKHVPDAVVFNLRARVAERFEAAGTPYFLMGETAMGWDGSSGPDAGGNPENYGTIARYIGEDALDGQFDFVLYYAASLQFLQDTPSRGMAHIDFWTHASLDRFGDAIMTPYLGSHDTSRWISMQSDPGRAGNQWDNFPSTPTTDEPYDRMYVALGWLFSLPGAPLLYYGDEYGQPGGADPDNRRFMRFGDALDVRERSQLNRVSALGRARASLPGLRSRSYRTLFVDETVSVVARGVGDEVVLAVINRGAGASRTVTVSRDVAAGGTVFRDVLGGARATVTGGAVDLAMPARSVGYYAIE